MYALNVTLAHRDLRFKLNFLCLARKVEWVLLIRLATEVARLATEKLLCERCKSPCVEPRLALESSARSWYDQVTVFCTGSTGIAVRPIRIGVRCVICAFHTAAVFRIPEHRDQVAHAPDHPAACLLLH